MKVLIVVLVGLGLAGGLAGCGKKGAPHTPGPPDKVIYPGTYPPE